MPTFPCGQCRRKIGPNEQAAYGVAWRGGIPPSFEAFRDAALTALDHDDEQQTQADDDACRLLTFLHRLGDDLPDDISDVTYGRMLRSLGASVTITCRRCTERGLP